MALRAGSDLTDWESIFTNAGITTASAKIYAQTFSSEGITRDTIHMLDRTMLKELGIKNMGEVLIILKLAKENPASPTTHVKPTAKPPQLNSGMTPQQFRKFKIDWDVFTKMTNLSDTQMNVQLYNCAEETVQNSIINTYPEFFNADPNKLLDMLEVLVTMKSNPIVHRISFSSIAQGDGEPVSDYLIRLKSGARDCNFICPNCDHDLSGIYVKDQFIRGIASVAYPQSNGRAELAVKTAKRIVNGNTDTQGSLDNDKAARAILQYRNTPIQGIGLSPAQLLLHRRLRDSIPSQPFLYKPHPEWIAAAQRRELILQKRNAKLVERYNRHTHNLCPLQAGDTVTIQNPLNRRWNTTGKIISALPERQYKIRVDGSGRITLRNRRFLKKCNLKPTPTPIPSATLGPRIPSTNATVTHPPLSPCDSTCTATRPQQQTTHISPRLRASRIPRALSRLLPHNKPGIKERHTSQATRPTRGGGGEM